MNGVAQLGGGIHLAGLDDLPEGAVLGEFPMNLDSSPWHAAAGLKGPGGEPGPQDNALVVRIAGGNAAGEGVAVEVVRLCGGGIATQKGNRGKGSGVSEKEPPGESALVTKGALELVKIHGRSL